MVTPNYFSTFGVRVLRGRGFTDADREGAPARRHAERVRCASLLAGCRPDRQAPRGGLHGTIAIALTVVGIVPETRYRDLRDARPSIYFPLRQTDFPVIPLTLAIRVDGRSANVIPAVRRAITERERGVAVASAVPFEAFLEGPLAQPRLNALLLLIFAGASVALAAVGLFGVMATMVRQRTRELGIRMAFGATAPDLRRLVMRRGLALAVAGSAAGVLGALATNRLLVAMLFGVSPTDGLTLAAVAVLLLAVSALATLLPAHSSTRIDPVIALRADG